MNKKILILTAAMAVALTACGPKEQMDENADPASPSPSAEAAATPDVRPTQAPPVTSPEASAEPVPTESAEDLPEQPQESEAASQPAESAAVVTAAPEEVDPLSTPDVSDQRGENIPTDEEVLSRYREADEAFRWFAVCTLPGIPDDVKMVEDVPYNRVADPRFNTMESLRGYLKTLFSDEIVDGLLPCGGRQYMDIDGKLYVSEGARGEDVTKGGVTLMVVWPEGQTPASCTVQAAVELLDWNEENPEPFVSGEQIYEFPYQKVGDKWVFTQFESIF